MCREPVPLALHGGAPVFPEGPPGWPPPDEDVRTALLEAYQDGSWGQYHGPHTQALVHDLQALLACEHVLLASSGTIAVELALRGVGVQPGDEVVMAGYDFPGNFRAVEAIGAKPVLVDVDPESWCLGSAELQRMLASQHEPPSDTRLRAVLVSHLHATLADMPRITALAQQHRLAVVEDACQVPGATVAGRAAGTWGDVGVWSFGGSKLLSAGRGGAMFTNSAAVHQRAKVFAERGNSAFPLSQLQAAVLRPQVAKLLERNRLRASRAALLAELIAPLPFASLPPLPAASETAFYKFPLRLATEKLSELPRETIIAALQAEGVAIDAGFRGFASRSRNRCRKYGQLPCSRQAAANTLLLHHPLLLKPEESTRRVASALDKVVRLLAPRGNASAADRLPRG